MQVQQLLVYSQMHAKQTGNKALILNKCFRLTELVAKGESIAILDQGMAFGGGSLQNFGINSNTSANGFLKCMYRRKIVTEQNNVSSSPQKHSVKRLVPMNDNQSVISRSPDVKSNKAG